MQGWDVLAGRTAERAALDALLDGLKERRGRLVLVEGEAGIGKTRLCDYLLDRAAATGAATRSVTCWESEAIPAFWPWQRLLGSLPETGEQADPMTARVTLFSAIADALAERAATQPLVLVLDDAQWADEMSLAFLRFVAPALRAMPVLVAAGVRTGEPAGDDLTATAGRNAVRLHLTGLDRDDLAVLVRATTDSEPTPEDLDDLHRRTAGNPLFARELATLRRHGDTSLPPTVRAVLGRRIEAVDAATREALDVAAVVGEAARLDVIEATLGIDDGLARLANATGIATTSEEGTVTFRHPLLRDVLLDALGVAQRARLHQRVAAVLAERGAPAATLAGHYAAAAGAGSAAEAVRYGIEAGGEAVAMLAYEQAARHYERALRCLDLAPGACPRAYLLLLAGTALTAAGQPDRARQRFLEAAAAARQMGEVTAFAMAALEVGSGEGFEVTLYDEEQQSLLADAIDLVGESNPALRARLVARLSVARSLVEPEDRRRSAAEESLALARAAGDPPAVCDALAALCDAAAGPDDAEQRIAWASELVETAGQDVRRVLLGRRLLVVAHLERGDMTAYDAEVERYAADAARLRSPLYSWYVPLWRGMRAAMAGDLDTAARRIDQAEALGNEARSGNATLLVAAARGLAGVDDENLEGGLFEDLADSGMYPVWYTVVRAAAAAAQRRTDEARRLLDAAVPGLPGLPRDSEYLAVLVQAALAISRIGGHPLARQVYDWLLPHRHRFAVEGIAAYCHGSVERHLGLLAAVLGRPDDAAKHLAVAREVNAAAGAARLVALTEPRQAVPATPGDGVFRKDGEGWSVGLDGTTAHVRDSKGMRDLAVLLAQPGRSVAAIDLLGAPSGGDLGEVVDATARAAYKQRLADLDEEIDDADAAADLVRGERARTERDALIAELATAYGLGGRPRKAGDPAERARTAVTARIRDALKRIEAADATAGAHLRRSVKTGTFCVYDPVSPVRWRL